MNEIEVKILEVDRKETEKTLTRLLAKKVFDGDIETLFFDYPDGRISKERNVLRLRQQDNKVELTYKTVKVTQKAKQAKECSVEISDLASMKQILENLGLRNTESMNKHRVSYTLNDTRFDFDKYSGKYDFIPEFLEIEAKTADTTQRYAELLGFRDKACLTWSTAELIQYYRNKKN